MYEALHRSLSDAIPASPPCRLPFCELFELCAIHDTSTPCTDSIAGPDLSRDNGCVPTDCRDRMMPARGETQNDYDMSGQSTGLLSGVGERHG